MKAQSLSITLADSSSSVAQGRFVHLTQPVENGMQQTATMRDIAQMIARARSGDTAHSYKKGQCNAGINDTGVAVRLDFWSWPSFADLKYTVESSFGEVSPPEILSEYTEFSIVFGLTDVVNLDFMLESIERYYWETPCYTPHDGAINNVTVELDGLTAIRASDKIFGVLRVRGKKIGAKHRITAQLIKSVPDRPDQPLPDEGITLDTIEEYWGYSDIATWNGELLDTNETVNLSGLSLDNLQITVTARWFDESGEEQTESMMLTIPQCVQDLLASCGDAGLEQWLANTGFGNTAICGSPGKDGDAPQTVYLSGCDGSELGKRPTKDDPDSWCE